MMWCLHGAVGMASDWEAFRREMGGAGHEVAAVDLWSYLDRGPLTLEEFGLRFSRRVEAGDDDPVLVGYSMGGRLGLHALLAASASWKAAVIVSAHPGLTRERDRILRMGEDARWAARALHGDWAGFLEDWHNRAVLGTPPPEFDDRGRLEPRREAVARSFMEWSLGKQDDLRPRLRRVECPVLWVTGSRDGKFTALGEVAAAQLRHGCALVVPAAGHRVPWEAPGSFAAAVRSFVESL